MGFTYYIPTKLLFGSGVLDKLSEYKLPGKKALIVTGGTSIKKYGYLNRLTAQLKISGTEYILFDKILPNPIAEHVEEAAKIVKKEKCDFIIGIGGGSSIDSAKAIAIMSTNDGVYWDYISGGSGKGKQWKTPLSVVAIPTTSGTGTEIDPWTVISSEVEKIGNGDDSTFPVLSIVDPSLTVTVPKHLTAFQGFDALFHSIEGYINERANLMSDLYAEKAIELIGKYLPLAVENGSDINAREQVMFASTLSGIVESTSGCTSCHSLEHALSAVKPNLEHGAGLIMLAVEYYRYFVAAKVLEDRFVAMAKLLGYRDAAVGEDFITALTELMIKCKVNDLKMSDYGFEKDSFKEITAIAYDTMGELFERDRVELDSKSAQKIYEKSYR